MLWIKEVEMVESVDDLKSSWSIRGTQTPDFEVLDARIASALNRIIHDTRFKKKVSLEEQHAQKEDRFLRGRQTAYLIYGYFRVTGANDYVGNYADLFTFVLRNDDIQEFDSKWDEILLSVTQITSDDILEGLYKSRVRESEKLKTVLELYNMEIHQKKAEPDYHRLKTMVKRSIEQNLRIKDFEARNGKYERNAVVKNQGTKKREQRTLGDCWRWKANGQCSKENNCSFRHDMNKRAKPTQPNHSPRSSTRQNERKSSRTRSPRGRSAMSTDTHTSGSTVKKPHLIKNGIRIQCNTENFVPIVVPGLSTSSSSSLPSSTSMTPSRQEVDHPTSSSSSSTSPTMTSSTMSSDSVARKERGDPCGIDSNPAVVSSKHVERHARGDLCSSGTPEEELSTKPTKNSKPNKNEDHDLER